MLEDLGNIAEVVGAVAVVVTLIYLALQVRLARKAWVRQNERETTSLTITAMFQMVQNPDLTRIHLLGMEDYTGNLTREERLIWHAWLWGWISAFEQAAIDVESGEFHETELLDVYRTGFGSVLKSPGGRTWWQQNRILFRQSTRKLIDEAIETTQFTTLDVVLASEPAAATDVE